VEYAQPTTENSAGNRGFSAGLGRGPAFFFPGPGRRGFDSRYRDKLAGAIRAGPRKPERPSQRANTTVDCRVTVPEGSSPSPGIYNKE